MAEKEMVVNVALEDIEPMKAILHCVCKVVNDSRTPAWIKQEFARTLPEGFFVSLSEGATNTKPTAPTEGGK